MKQRYRIAILKLLAVSLLFLQLSLSFHSHAPEESIRCDACVTTDHADHHDAETTDECWAGIFFHTNLAGDAVLPVAAPVQLILPKWQQPTYKTPLLASHTLPLGSRAPPIL